MKCIILDRVKIKKNDKFENNLQLLNIFSTEGEWNRIDQIRNKLIFLSHFTSQNVILEMFTDRGNLMRLVPTRRLT